MIVSEARFFERGVAIEITVLDNSVWYFKNLCQLKWSHNKSYIKYVIFFISESKHILNPNHDNQEGDHYPSEHVNMDDKNFNFTFYDKGRTWLELIAPVER